ncbi:Mobile element protein [hydrothermal vent metagenome]|uniref:Mobile element protein n=1 Tax=hydrothermal vent metagenome TaxID=652676 RepID=A0A3B1DCB1_9ZZZZ
MNSDIAKLPDNPEVLKEIKVIRHIRYKYACRSCEGVESEGGAVRTAKLPAQIIPQGIVTPGLLAYILISKYADAMPFYRQEKAVPVVEEFKQWLDKCPSCLIPWGLFDAYLGGVTK